MKATESGHGWLGEMTRRHHLPAAYAPDFLACVAPLADDLVRLRNRLDRPVIAGISGAQGTGKSTLAIFLREWLKRECGLTAITLSLDDFYLTKAARVRLAASRHPLLATRGVPGTHDVELLRRVMDRLTGSSGDSRIHVPRFDKGTDDRRPEGEWRWVEVPVDVIVLEGWCIGARPQTPDELSAPLNRLEAAEDPQGTWRRYVNGRLADDYRRLFGQLDALVMLRAPSFEKVRQWRGLQEERLRAGERSGATARSPRVGQTESELDRFVLYFERLTRHMLATMPGYADAVLPLDAAHRIVGLDRREGGCFER